MTSPAPDATTTAADNPLLTLDYEPALAAIGDDYYDAVAAADFPEHHLRFRNDDILKQLGLDPTEVSDDHFIAAFGKFQQREPLLALRYHGYQFGTYNPFLGDGRGFLYGQVRGLDGELYDFGTKGSGTTPYSRGGDGRLTLKGGVREVLAAEALHALGVRTSRTLSMIETGEQLWRGDEPSPTRSSVMVRCSRSHIRFGTFERLDYLDRTDLIQRLLEHVIDIYYPAARLCTDAAERYAQFYDELVERTAALAAQWMAVGFCHGVLNTDNMSITGESFDYGPYAWMDTYDPTFTAAYFDYGRRYCYRNQPIICRWNLSMLQRALKRVIPEETLSASLAQFETHYLRHYETLMLAKLGIDALPDDLGTELVTATIALLESVQVGYHTFFLELSRQFSPQWREDAEQIFSTTLQASDEAAQAALKSWRQQYHRCLQARPETAMAGIGDRLRATNPETVLLRPEIEAIWEPITVENDWQPFYDLLKRAQNPFLA
jgi:uncharacterized protein YdiU (UPF0061 family)